MSERFDLAHIESCMGGNLKSPLFDLEQYGQRMKVSRETACAGFIARLTGAAAAIDSWSTAFHAAVRQLERA